MEEVAADTLAKERANEFIAAHKADLPKMTLWKLRNLISPWPGTPNQAFNWAIALSYGLLLPAMVWGLLLGWRSFGSANGALYAPVGAILVNVVLLYGDHRFRISIAPLLIVFAVWAVSQWWNKWQPADSEG